MTSVAQLLRAKVGQDVHTISPEASVLDAIRQMADKNVGALVAMERDQIVGLVTERDYARKIVLMGRSSNATPVRAIMTAPVVCVGPAQGSEECMALMTEHRLRHLPVIENGVLVGLVSIGDLVKDIIEEQKFVIEQLQHYIVGDRAAG